MRRRVIAHHFRDRLLVRGSLSEVLTRIAQSPVLSMLVKLAIPGSTRELLHHFTCQRNLESARVMQEGRWHPSSAPTPSRSLAMLCQLGRVAVRRAAHAGLQPCALRTLTARQLLGRPHAAKSQPSFAARGFSCSHQAGTQSSQRRRIVTSSNNGRSEESTGGSNGNGSSSGTEDKSPPTEAPSSVGGATRGEEDEAAEEEEQKQASAQTYRQIVSTWISTREANLRGLASESSLAIRDFLADPSLTIFGRWPPYPAPAQVSMINANACALQEALWKAVSRIGTGACPAADTARVEVCREYALSKLKDIANREFDLSKFRGACGHPKKGRRRHQVAQLRRQTAAKLPGCCGRNSRADLMHMCSGPHIYRVRVQAASTASPT